MAKGSTSQKPSSSGGARSSGGSRSSLANNSLSKNLGRMGRNNPALDKFAQQRSVSTDRSTRPSSKASVERWTGHPLVEKARQSGEGGGAIERATRRASTEWKSGKTYGYEGPTTRSVPMSDIKESIRSDRAAEQARQDKYATALERAKEIGRQNTQEQQQASNTRYNKFRADIAEQKYKDLYAQAQKEQARGGSGRDALRRAEQYKVQSEVARKAERGEKAPFFSWEPVKMPDGSEYTRGSMGQYERVSRPPISGTAEKTPEETSNIGGREMRDFLGARGLQSTQKNWDNYVPMEEAQKMYRTDMDQQARGSTPVFTEAPQSRPSNFSLPKFSLSGIPSPSTSQMTQGLQSSMPSVSGAFSNQAPPTPSLTKMTNDQELNRIKSQTSRPYGSAMFGVPSAPPFPQWGVA